MQLRIAAWNIEGRLSELAVNRRGTPNRILHGIQELRADIILLTEAFERERLDGRVRSAIVKMGYHIFEVPYEEGGAPRPNSAVIEPSMLLLSKLPFASSQRVRLGNLRNAIVASVQDPRTKRELRIIGVHLDDRSELLRLQQVPELIELIQSSTTPTIVMGDFNAVHGDDHAAKLLRTPLVKLLARVAAPHLAAELSDMAQGETLQRLMAATHLYEADPQHRPTATPKMRGQEWLPSIRLIQIDHILLASSIQSTDFLVARNGGSDHRAISVTVNL